MWRSFEYHAQDLWRSVYENRPRAHLGGGARSFARALTNAAWIFPRRSGLRPFELSWVSTDSQHSSQQQGLNFLGSGVTEVLRKKWDVTLKNPQNAADSHRLDERLGLSQGAKSE